MEKASAAGEASYSFHAAYIEIYNEQVLDLLNPRSGRGALTVRWKADRGFYVSGCPASSSPVRAHGPESGPPA